MPDGGMHVSLTGRNVHISYNNDLQCESNRLSGLQEQNLCYSVLSALDCHTSKVTQVLPAFTYATASKYILYETVEAYAGLVGLEYEKGCR